MKAKDLIKKGVSIDRHGGNIEEWPEHLQIREMPFFGDAFPVRKSKGYKRSDGSYFTRGFLK